MVDQENPLIVKWEVNEAAPAIETPATFRGRAMSLLVHSDTKVGKSTLLNSCRAPRLLLDSEAAYRYLPGMKIFWDPMTQAPPKYTGLWETCVVIVQSYSTIKRAYDWLNSGQHPFVSCNIDSVSEVQTQAKYEMTADGRMTQQLWGDLLTDMERLIRGFRDLSENPARPLEFVGISAMTQQRDGKYRPYVQGQLQVKMPYFLDVIGYMWVDSVADPLDPSKVTKMRRMIVVPHIQYEAGERVQGKLGEVVDEPTVPKMLDMVFGPLKVTGETPNEGEEK